MINDGTGILPSADEKYSKILAEYIVNKTGTKSVLDCGTGMGYLPQAFKNIGVKSKGAEGNEFLFKKSIYPENVVCVNLCDDVSSLLNTFDLTTSFEMIEHIPRKYQNSLWSNLKKISPRHLCSIHIKNQEDNDHCTINTQAVWEKWFTDVGIKFTYLHDFPLINEWNCSVFYLLELSEYVDSGLEPGFPHSLMSMRIK